MDVSKTTSSFYRRLYVAWLIDTQRASNVPALTEVTGMPRRTAQDTLAALADLDIDGQDLEGDTLHLMGWQNDQLVAYARLLDPESHAGDVVIGRVIVAPQARGHSLGHDLMDQALHNIKENWPQEPVFLSAQAHLQSLYAKHGFNAVGEPYFEDNIPHIGMRLNVDAQG